MRIWYVIVCISILGFIGARSAAGQEFSSDIDELERKKMMQEALTEAVQTTQAGEEIIEVKLLDSETDAKWLCELFLLRVVNGGISEAFDELKPYFAIPEAEFSMVERQTYQQIELIKPRFGNILGYQLVKEENIQDSVLRFTYLMKLENHAIVWKFYFYKPGDKWMFNEFYINGKLSEAFE